MHALILAAKLDLVHIHDRSGRYVELSVREAYVCNNVVSVDK